MLVGGNGAWEILPENCAKCSLVVWMFVYIFSLPIFLLQMLLKFIYCVISLKKENIYNRLVYLF